MRRGFRPVLGQLEGRTLLATVTWINPTGDDWDRPSNWSTGAIPGPGDDVVINQTNISVTHSSPGSDFINSLTLSSGQSTLDLSGGSLSISSSSSVAGTLAIIGGTLSTEGALTVSGSMTWQGGTISGSGTLTIANQASLSMGDINGATEVLSGVTLNNLGTANGTLIGVASTWIAAR